MKLKLVFLLILFLSGCQETNKFEEDLRWLLYADPIKDAKLALSEGDTRYFGVVGMFINVPLFDENCITEKTVRFIRISDLIESYEQNKLQAIAPVYAEAYNFQILQYQKDNGQKQCGSKRTKHVCCH